MTADPDSWPFLQLFASLLLLAAGMAYTGALAEESSQREMSESGTGFSYKSVSAMLFCLVPAVLAASFAGRICRALGMLTQSPDNPASAPSPLYYAIAIAAGCAVTLAAFMFFALLPLAWGRANSGKCLGRMRFIGLLCAVFVPAARLVTLPARRILAAGGKTSGIGSVTEEDVLELMDTAEENDFIDENQKEMIGNIFELDEITAADIMTHRTEVEAVPVTASVDDIIDMAVERGYSRIPVYDGALDNIIGIAYVKDFLAYVGKGTRGVDLRKLYRPTLFVPESCRVREMLMDFKQKKIQLAVVVDEYGGTAGIVTMEDILESIVGDINDEYDEEESLISENPDGSLTCDGYAEIEDLFARLGLGEVPGDIASDTVGGLVTGLLERIPKRDERPTVEYRDIELTALDADERRITSVLARKKAAPVPGSGEAAGRAQDITNTHKR